MLTATYEVLMHRDGLTREQAIDVCKECHKRVAECHPQSYDAIEDIMTDELGLEMNYVEDLMENALYQRLD